MGLNLAKALELDAFWLALKGKKRCCPIGWNLNALIIHLSMKP